MQAVFDDGNQLSQASNDAALQKLAKEMKLRSMPPRGSWLSVLCQMMEQLPTAVIICDMRVPGLPITFVNTAGLQLTGYKEEELFGQNCRILQGSRTEGPAVRQMTDSLRRAAPTMLRVTNYRADGSLFKNVVSLHPVMDTAGTYRYSIGLQCDEANWSKESSAFEKLRRVLPTQFDAALQPNSNDAANANVDEDAQRKQWQKSIAKFTRLVWSMDWEGTLTRFLSKQDMFVPLLDWAQKKDPNAAAQLELLYRMLEMRALPPSHQGQRATELCTRYLGFEATSGETAVTKLIAHTESSHMALAQDLLPKFVQTKACLPIVEALVAGQPQLQMTSAQALLWSEYVVPPDVAGWVHSFVPVAECYPACIVISDMTVPGNPMCYVNQEFCRVTGYQKHEVQGRNCRFLQGPKTEPQSVAVIQDTLRRGVDCHVKITNYRKTGELFLNLLTMRPVHDSNGVLRFCIGVQFEVQHTDPSLKKRLAMLSKMIQLLPKTLEVASKAIGNVHKRDEAQEELNTALDNKLLGALDGAKKVYTDTAILHDAGHYANHHADQLAHVQRLANTSAEQLAAQADAARRGLNPNGASPLEPGLALPVAAGHAPTPASRFSGLKNVFKVAGSPPKIAP